VSETRSSSRDSETSIQPRDSFTDGLRVEWVGSSSEEREGLDDASRTLSGEGAFLDDGLDGVDAAERGRRRLRSAGKVFELDRSRKSGTNAGEAEKEKIKVSTRREAKPMRDKIKS